MFHDDERFQLNLVTTRTESATELPSTRTRRHQAR